MTNRFGPRRRNLNIPGHAHELTFSCYQGYAFLSKDRTRLWLVDSINAARDIHDFALWAWVFMPDHVHLIVYPRREIYDIADIRGSIKEPVARNAIAYMKENAPEWIAKITRQRGKKTERLFWQSGGGYDRNIDNPKTLWKMIDYIHANPIRRELVKRAIDWEWSSATWYETQVQYNGLLPIDEMPEAWSSD